MFTDEVASDNLGLAPVVRGKREVTEQVLAAAAAADSETAPKRGRGRPAKWKVVLYLKLFLQCSFLSNLLCSLQNGSASSVGAADLDLGTS